MESGKGAYLVRTEDFGTGRRGQRDVNNNLFIRFFSGCTYVVRPYGSMNKEAYIYIPIHAVHTLQVL
jgi:hypothetical protein